VIRNAANQIAGGQVINATSGTAFIGTVTVYVTGDGGTQALGSVGSGLCTHEGNGYYTYTPSQDETNYASVAFTFIGAGAVPSSTTYDTLTLAQSAALNVASSGASVTARQLITRALKRIGVVGAGQTASSEDATDALFLLNALLDSFATERLMVPCIVRTPWTIVSGTGSYTVGTGGDVDIARPVFVHDIRFIDTSTDPDQESGLGVLTDRSYSSISQKAATATYPTHYYYNPTFTGTGLATITFWPVPTSATLEGVIYVPTALTQVASLNTTLVLQPGYRMFLQEQLAVTCAPEWGVPVPGDLRESARESKANIKRANIRIVEQATMEGCLLGGGGMYDIYSDQ
jgi:hypothetical protein